ncbi:unnamed protein product [Effrenium voratum]|nr:unnamed protein product [Effrenium voratum]
MDLIPSTRAISFSPKATYGELSLQLRKASQLRPVVCQLGSMMRRGFSAAALLVAASAIRQNLENAQATRDVIRGEYGSYELGRKLGSGAYGVVYLATERDSGRRVVAKIIDIATPESQFSFHTERHVWQHMQSCAGYPHPNIIRHFEVLKLSSRQGVVIMELASGGALSDLLYDGVSAEGALRGKRTAEGDALITDERAAKEIFSQLAAGVQWLAQCGVSHKDLKPDNVMLSRPLSEGGVLKIIDFGLAMVLQDMDPGSDANMYYNLASKVDVRSNPVGARTFDDFAVGMMLAEIGTGVPPFFNPDYDYFSEKEGNLQKEKGILYILQDRKACAKGDAGIWFPKRDLATGKIAVKAAVKEVVGRSLYYLQNHRHFAYASAVENGIGNTQLLRSSWLYNSESAMALLQSLLQWREEQRADPRALLSSAWLADLPAAPAVHEPEVHSHVPAGPPATERLTTAAPEPEPETEAAQEVTMCKMPYKERGPPSVCKVKHFSHEDCWVQIRCRGSSPKLMQMAQSFGAQDVPGCYNCEVLSR